MKYNWSFNFGIVMIDGETEILQDFNMIIQLISQMNLILSGIDRWIYWPFSTPWEHWTDTDQFDFLFQLSIFKYYDRYNEKWVRLSIY